MERRRHADTDDWGGPYVGMAFFCRDLQVDETGTPSFVQVGDQVTLSEPRQIQELKLIIGVRAGERTGRAHCSIDIVAPDGSVARDIISQTRRYAKGDGITNWQFKLDFETDLEGTFWFDVRINHRLVTRLPLGLSVRQESQTE